MAQGSNNNFLSIPSQEGLFRTVRVQRSEAENSNSPFDDEDEEETEEDVRLIPRCSPVPRKRGPSIADETAEYMRIRFALPNRRVSFADTTGRDLIDVRMFVPFDSDEEDDSRWDEEEARYRKAYNEPTYRVWPEFQELTGTELELSVHTNKLEVESVTSVPDEPLSFQVMIRVLNISFHKSVYVRSTMDGWITHFDYPAEYVHGSNDGETDKFSVTLSFASPYLFNGARIDFVARYETSDGEFWANNSGRNYSVTLIQSYEEDTTQSINAENIELRGILKPLSYRTNYDYDESYDKGDDLERDEFESAENKTSLAQPTIVQPEIDIETAKNLCGSPQSAGSSSTAGCPLSTTDSLYGEPLPPESTSLHNSPQTEELQTTHETIQSSTLHEPQSQSTSQFSKPQVHICNVVPSMPLPTVCVHPYDEYYEFEYSNKPDHSLHPQQDELQDLQHEMAAQVPFEFGPPSSGGFSDAPNIQEKDDLREKKDVEAEIEKTEVNVLDEQYQSIEEEKTETYFHVMEESVQRLFSEVMNDNHAAEDVEEHSLTMDVENLTEGLHHLKRSQEQEIKLVSLGKAEASKVVDRMLTEESHMGLIRQDIEDHSSPICLPAETSDHELVNVQEEGPGEDPNYAKQTIRTCMSTSDHQTTKPENSELDRVSETSSTASDFAFDLQSSTVHSLKEDNLTYQGDECYQTHKDSESKLPLPVESCKISTISKNESEVSLKKCVIASFTFFSAAVWLAVGIQEPSIFLVVGLFLLSLCF